MNGKLYLAIIGSVALIAAVVALILITPLFLAILIAVAIAIVFFILLALTTGGSAERGGEVAPGTSGRAGEARQGDGAPVSGEGAD